MKGIKVFLMISGGIFLAAILVNATQSVTEHNNISNTKITHEEDAVKDYRVYAVALPSELSFAGEKVPLDNPDIKERADREFLVNTYWQSNGFLLIKRTHKYFPIITPILKKNGIPDDFKYLAVIESGLQNVVSPAKATGFWQFLKNTGKEYGLEINDNVDERYHIEKATEAACSYLKKAKETLGSWTLAAAAYNAGVYGVRKQLERQKETRYYDLLLGEETGRYIFRILALKEIISHPERYGFMMEKKDFYTPIPTYRVEVDTAISDLTSFAKKFDINYKILKIHNPWLRDTNLSITPKKKYYIQIPEKGHYKLSR